MRTLKQSRIKLQFFKLFLVSQHSKKNKKTKILKTQKKDEHLSHLLHENLLLSAHQHAPFKATKARRTEQEDQIEMEKEKEKVSWYFN